jgi:hypothetical protein
MAKHYGQLPSYVRDNASTYDLMIYDIDLAWQQEQENRANGVVSVPPELSEQELLAIFEGKK